MKSGFSIAVIIVSFVLISACGGGDAGSESDASVSDDASTSAATESTVQSLSDEPPVQSEYAGFGREEVIQPADRLESVLAAQPDSVQARYGARHPAETLMFFGVEPGMTVVEALPGNGGYTRLLLPYLGERGKLIAANYPIELFRQFEFATDDFLAELNGWVEAFPVQAADWCAGDCADVSAYWIGDLPRSFAGRADLVLFIRAIHNMARFQNQGIDDYLDQAFADAFAILKPGGVLGIVQHASPESMPDDWASGESGYLKTSFVIARAEAAGFVLEAESDINFNPADQPSVDDVVWRLAPSFGTTEEGSEERASIAMIGESNRMTLKFFKPGRFGSD